MKLNDLNPETKRAILKAMTNGVLTRQTVMSKDFKLNLYTLTDLPFFANHRKETGLIEFMNETITLSQYNEIMEFYKETGNTQLTFLIDV